MWSGRLVFSTSKKIARRAEGSGRSGSGGRAPAAKPSSGTERAMSPAGEEASTSFPGTGAGATTVASTAGSSSRTATACFRAGLRARARRPALRLGTVLEVFLTMFSGSSLRCPKARLDARSPLAYQNPSAGRASSPKPRPDRSWERRRPGRAGRNAMTGSGPATTRHRGRRPEPRARSLPSSPGPLAAAQSRLDVVETGQDVRDAVDDVVGAALVHPRVGALALLLALRRVHRLHLLERQPDLVTAHGEADGPHAGVQPFLDARDRVVDLDARLDGGDLEVDDVLQAHVGIRPAGGHVAGAHGRVRHVTLPPGILHGDGDVLALVNLDEDHGRRHAPVVHGCARPVEQDGLDLSAIAALIGEGHALSSG